MLYVSSILLVSLPRYTHFFFLMIRRPPRSTLFPYRRSSDLLLHTCRASQLPYWWVEESSQEPGQPPLSQSRSNLATPCAARSFRVCIARHEPGEPKRVSQSNDTGESDETVARNCGRSSDLRVGAGASQRPDLLQGDLVLRVRQLAHRLRLQPAGVRLDSRHGRESRP